jgi:hypothetical protein
MMPTTKRTFSGENFMRRVTTFAALLLFALLAATSGLAQDVISTFIGGGPNGIPALDAFLYQPYGVAVDATGNVYFAAFSQHRVFKVSTGGTITVVAGSGALGYSGDGVTGGAGNADLYHPFGVAVDTSGNVYFSDQYNCVVRKVDTTKTITTIAGTVGQCNATGSDLSYPSGLALDGSGNLFITDTNNCKVRKLVLATKVLSVVAGTGTCSYTGDGSSATAATMYYPQGVAVDTAGDLFISDTNNCVIREVTKSSGKISTIAGNHTCAYTGDGNPATSAEIYSPEGIAVNGAGTKVTFADYQNQRIRQFTVGGNITTVAGNGTACGGACGEGGAATSAQLYYPLGLAANSAGSTYYIGNNYNQVVDKFTVGGNLTLIAGNHSNTTETIYNGAPATGVQLANPYGLFNDSSNNVYITDSHNYRVRELVNSTGLVNFFAGDGIYGYSGDGSSAISAEVTYPYGVAKDSSGNVYIADSNACVIRKVSGGNINTFAGLVTGPTSTSCGFSGDGGAALSAKLYTPYGVAIDSKNNIYIADFTNDAVRKVSGGVITTIAGIGLVGGFSGDGGPAVNAQLNGPTAVAVDPAGNVFIADYYNCRIRGVNAATGIITTVAGNGSCAAGLDGLATSNPVEYPQGVAVDANDNLFIGDYSNRVRWVAPNGIMTTVAGTGANGFDGDGGTATLALLSQPTGIALDTAGNILVSEYGNGRVRKITSFPALSTSTGSLSYGLTGVGSSSSPQTVTVSAFGAVTISNISTNGAYSEADDCPASLPNGTNCAMYVYFTPTASGTAHGNVTLNSNGFFNQVNTVALTGSGSAIALTGSPVIFGNQLVKTTSAGKVVTIKNSGTSAITMGAITLTDSADYSNVSTCPASGATLAGGASCTLTLKFKPQKTGALRGTVVINDSDPSSPQLVGLSGTGTSNVSLSPNAVTFATTAVTVTSAATKITLTNNTGASITLGNPAVTVTGPFLSAGSTTCTPDLIIASTGTCVINVQFKPTKTGFASGTISVADNDVTGTQSVALQGYGTGIKFTPGSVTFGATNKGTQVSAAVTITNVGTTPVAFTGGEISGTNSADFSTNYNQQPPCGNNANSPLQPGKTCAITIYFVPSKTGSESATYVLFDNSVGSSQSLPLKGTGQ